jgi:hypothetical protein
MFKTVDFFQTQANNGIKFDFASTTAAASQTVAAHPHPQLNASQTHHHIPQSFAAAAAAAAALASSSSSSSGSTPSTNPSSHYLNFQTTRSSSASSSSSSDMPPSTTTTTTTTYYHQNVNQSPPSCLSTMHAQPISKVTKFGAGINPTPTTSLTKFGAGINPTPTAFTQHQQQSQSSSSTSSLSPHDEESDKVVGYGAFGVVWYVMLVCHPFGRVGFQSFVFQKVGNRSTQWTPGCT